MLKPRGSNKMSSQLKNKKRYKPWLAICTRNIDRYSEEDFNRLYKDTNAVKIGNLVETIAFELYLQPEDILLFPTETDRNLFVLQFSSNYKILSKTDKEYADTIKLIKLARKISDMV